MQIKSYAVPPRISVIDYGMGNIRSVVKALQFLKADVDIVRDVEGINSAEALVLPGVGAFGYAMQNLDQMKIIPALVGKVQNQKTPLLGICLGMQLLAESSEEKGQYKGLGLIEGKVLSLDSNDTTCIPHVGWTPTKSRPSILFGDTTEQKSFYYDHSLHLQCPDDIVAATISLGTTLVAAIEKDNIFAAQFHPEKSQRTGLHLLRRYLDYCVEREAVHVA